MAANLKEVRERIKSVISTQQITKAMKMVSAAKLRRAQQAIVEMRPYANRLNVMLGNVLANTQGDFNSEFGKQREINRVCLVLVTSSKGLCGAFNTNIIKALTARINGSYAEHYAAGKVTIVCIGKRGYDYARKHFTKATIVNDYVDLFSDLTFEATVKVASGIMDKFAGGDYDVVEVAYGQFKNAGTQFPMVDTYLPVLATPNPVEGKKQSKADYLFEPDQVTLLDHLIPSILRTTFFKYLLDTHASEHGARMTAMDKATENAEDLLKDLKISYNKARQEAITRELSEIVGGAAALESA